MHGEPVAGLEPLPGGYWSHAWGYRVGGRDLVLRVGHVVEGFEMDRAAVGFAAPDLPVPEVLEVGTGLGAHYAVSARRFGQYLEHVAVSAAGAAGGALARLLRALRATPAPEGATVDWFGSDPAVGWRDWLGDGLVDGGRRPTTGWRERLADQPGADAVFERAAGRVREMLVDVPERRDLVHGDLLNRNVLVSDDATEVTAVFSWKCSVRGDFLYDAAWCTFWSTWHPGIEAADVWSRVGEVAAGDPGALTGAAARHHCYELHVGATHLGWNAWVGDDAALAAVADRTEAVLARGPLAEPA